MQKIALLISQLDPLDCKCGKNVIDDSIIKMSGATSARLKKPAVAFARHTARLDHVKNVLRECCCGAQPSLAADPTRPVPPSRPPRPRSMGFQRSHLEIQHFAGSRRRRPHPFGDGDTWTAVTNKLPPRSQGVDFPQVGPIGRKAWSRSASRWLGVPPAPLSRRIGRRRRYADGRSRPSGLNCINRPYEPASPFRQ